MSKFSTESPAGKTEWKQAYQAVRRLASVQQQLPANGDMDGAWTAMESGRTTVLSDGIETVDSEELAQAIREIEHAANALQQAQPSLETWVKQEHKQGRRPKALLILIGTLWLATTLITLALATTVAYYVL